MVVAVEPVVAEVGNKDVGPAVVVEIRDGHAEAPAVVGDAGLVGHVGKGSVVIVVKERGMGRGALAAERIVGRAVHQIDVEPAVVVVVDQAHAGAVGLQNVFLLRRAHFMAPAGKPRGLGHVLEDHRALFHKPAGGDGPLVLVVNGSEYSGGGNAAHPALCGLSGFLSGAGCVQKQEDENRVQNRAANLQEEISIQSQKSAPGAAS